MDLPQLELWHLAAAAGIVVLVLAVVVARALSRATDNRATLDRAEQAREQAEQRATALEAERREAENRAATLQEAVRRLEAEAADDRERFDRQTAEERQRFTELTKRLEESRDVIAAREKEFATLELEKRKDAQHAAERIAELTSAREAMTKEFRLLAEDVMSKHSQTFKQQNREQLDGLLTPLRQKIVEFQTGMTDAQKQAAEGRARLAEQIRHLSEHSSKMTEETVNLTRALKGRAQTQGAWGEMVLSTILEKSGLREGEEYVTQQSETMEDGKRLRPDVVINLPNDHKIIVDSKVSLVAFEEYVNATDDDVRAVALKRHVASMRSHVNDLSGKDYSRIAGSTLDYEIMFVPIEAALSVALNADPGLTGYAIDKNIAIATPTNLMMALRTVGSLWQVDRQQKNAEVIADRAGKLYDKFLGFVGDLALVEKHLGNAAKAHGDAMGKLTEGSGNLVRQAEMLKELGAKTKKSLPNELVEQAGADLSPADTLTPPSSG